MSVQSLGPPALNFGHAPRLELTLSNREKTGVQFQAGKTGNHSSKVDWLNQVEGEWNRFMYKTALDWKEFLVEVADLLVDVSAQGVADKGKWISLFRSGPVRLSYEPISANEQCFLSQQISK